MRCVGAWRHGYQILEAGTGGEGLALIDSEQIDALILDVNLPDMSGFDIVRVAPLPTLRPPCCR